MCGNTTMSRNGKTGNNAPLERSVIYFFRVRNIGFQINQKTLRMGLRITLGNADLASRAMTNYLVQRTPTFKWAEQDVNTGI
jgi:hypothetical protein